MLTTAEIKKNITNTTLEYFEKGKSEFGISSPAPKILFNLKGNRVAGTANSGKNIIRYNLAIAEQNYKEFIERTPAHEVAHIIQDALDPHSSPHGRAWKKVMWSFGKSPNRTHSYDTSNIAPARKIKKYYYLCGCNDKTIGVTKKVHDKIQRGVKYFCSKCRCVLKEKAE